MWLWREVCGLKCVMFSPCNLLSQVLRTYNVLDMKNTTCQDLQIEVTVMGHVEYTSECWGRRHGVLGLVPGAESQFYPAVVAASEDYEEDYGDEEYSESLGPAGDDPGALSQPVTPLQVFEGRRSRRRREAPKVADEQESRVQYTVCIWWV